MFKQLMSCFDGIRKLASLVDQILVSGGNFLTIAICAHALSLTEQGKFTYIFASYMALLLINIAGIFQGAAVRAPAQEQNGYKTTLARLQLLQAFFLSLFVSLVWLIAGKYIGWEASGSEAWLLFIFLLVQQLADFDRRTAYIFSGSKRAVYSSAMVYPIRIIALLFISPNSVSQVLLILIFSALIPGAIIFFTAFRPRYGALQSWGVATKDHISYSRLFIAGAPLGWLWSYIPIFMLGSLYGKEQAALLASIRGISNVANVLMEQLETKIVADWARIRHGDGALVMGNAAYRFIKIGISFWLLGMVVVAFFGREIVALVLGDLYAPHWHLLAIGWFGYGVYFLVRVSGIKHRALGSNQVEFIGNVFGVVTALLAGFILIPAFHATGAAWLYVLISLTMWWGQNYSAKKLA